MSRIRLTAVAVMLAGGLLLGGTGVAQAQDISTLPTLTKVVPVNGKAKNGKKFNGTFTIQRFVQRSGKTFAVGKLAGRFKGRHVSRIVSMPATLTNAGGASLSQIPPTDNACEILRLDLGPIDLNLLGLRVRTNEINVLIEGVRGPGNLLGNLLCGITGLLDPPTLANTPLGQLVQILNALLALSPRTG